MLNIIIPHKPTLREFGLTQADVERVQKRQKQNKAITALAISLLVFSVYGLAVWYIRHQGIADTWVGSLLLAVFYLIFAWLIGGFAFSLLYVIILPLTDTFDSVKTKIKKMWSSRFPEQSGSQREMYREYFQAQRSYEKEMESLNSKYPGFKECGFNIRAYSNLVFKQQAPSLYSKIQSIIAVNNKRCNVDYWRRMPAERFEEEVAEWFRKKGYNAKVTRYVGDGGIDIILTKGQQKALVQCKHYNGKVGVDPVRALFGVMSSEKVQKGYLACLHGATEGAADFAKKNGIIILTVENYIKGTYTFTVEEMDTEMEHVIGPFRVEKEIYDSLSEATKRADKVSSGSAFVIEFPKGYSERFYFVLKSDTETGFPDKSVKYSRIGIKEVPPAIEKKEVRIDNNREVKRESQINIMTGKPLSIDDIPSIPCSFETVDLTWLLEEAKLNPSIASSWKEFVTKTISGKPRLSSLLSSGTRVYSKEKSIIVVITVQYAAQKQWLEEKMLEQITSGYQTWEKDSDVSICCVVNGQTDTTVCYTKQKHA